MILCFIQVSRKSYLRAYFLIICDVEEVLIQALKANYVTSVHVRETRDDI